MDKRIARLQQGLDRYAEGNLSDLQSRTGDNSCSIRPVTVFTVVIRYNEDVWPPAIPPKHIPTELVGDWPQSA